MSTTSDIAAVLTDEVLDKPRELSIVRWEGRIHCAYLNDFRIAGAKPWAGGTTEKEWNVPLREVIRAFPELQQALGLDYLGKRVEAATPSAWQPIETAPKDGTFVILHNPGGEPEVSIGYYDGGPEWLIVEADIASTACHPKFWMPLPSAPSQIEEGKDNG